MPETCGYRRPLARVRRQAHEPDAELLCEAEDSLGVMRGAAVVDEQDIADSRADRLEQKRVRSFAMAGDERGDAPWVERSG